MAIMANVHVRDLPPEALDALKAAAKTRRRSLNAEIVAALIAHAERSARAKDLLERLAEGRRRWRKAFPDGYPPDLEPEAVIRRARDSR